ncbi:MAG: OmpA family protein [Myxococcota bacterium]
MTATSRADGRGRGDWLLRVVAFALLAAMKRRAVFRPVVIATIAALALGCGYSEEEWQLQLDKYNQLVAEHQSTESELAKTQKALENEQARVAKLESELTNMGVDIKALNQDLASRSTELNKLSATLEEREAALEQYRERARQLEKIKERFEKLRGKLNELTSLGLAVKIRNNRMIISLPGDVLFPSGQDRLLKGGEDILAKVAGIISADTSLSKRHYQVAGHTDDKPYRGAFRDNWGLSLMRARQVLTYLIDPKTGKLPVSRWSAAGFADTDPVATNETPEGRQANRRCELIVVPSAEEMLDLKAIAKPAPAG